MAYSMGARYIVVDPIGVGAGLMSFMTKRAEHEGITVLAADGREKAADSENYFNKRSEMWFAARERFVDGTVSIPDDDDQLQEELSKIGYEISAEKTRRVHSKDKIKKADYLGHSPGRADCLVYGLWAESFVEYEDEKTGLDDYGFEEDTADAYSVKTVL